MRNDVYTELVERLSRVPVQVGVVNNHVLATLNGIPHESHLNLGDLLLARVVQNALARQPEHPANLVAADHEFTVGEVRLDVGGLSAGRKPLHQMNGGAQERISVPWSNSFVSKPKKIGPLAL